MGNIRWSKIAPFVVLFGVVVLLWRALSLNPNELPLEKLGQPLPEFSLPNLYNMDEVITQHDLKNKVILVHVWATWCGVCRHEHSSLLKLKKLGVPMIGINYRDDPEKAKYWLESYGDPYLYNVVDMSGKYGLDLGVYGTPETFVVDGEGKLRYRFVGPIDSQADIKTIRTLIQELT